MEEILFEKIKIKIDKNRCYAFKNKKEKIQCPYHKKHGDFCGKHKNYELNGNKKITELGDNNFEEEYKNINELISIIDNEKFPKKLNDDFTIKKINIITKPLNNSEYILRNFYKKTLKKNSEITLEDFLVNSTFDYFTKEQLLNFIKSKNLLKYTKYYKRKININTYSSDILKKIVYNYFNTLLIGIINIDKITLIQRKIRSYLIQKKIKLHGPALQNKMICNNTTDFYNLETLDNIEDKYFFSYRDIDNFIYGFHIESFIQLINNSSQKINPYNRNNIPDYIQKNAKLIWNNLSLKNECTEITNVNKSNNIKIRTKSELLLVFQKLDLLGYQTDIDWVYNMSLNKLKILYRNLYNYWFYKLGLTNIMRQEIYSGNNLFSDSQIRNVRREINKYMVMEVIIKTMDKLISTSNQTNKNTCAIMILMAIGEINHQCVETNPWLM